MSNQALWQEYKTVPTDGLKKEIVMAYSNLVHYVIHHSKFYNQGLLNPRDYFQYGILGLSEAVDRFDPGFGTKFETYAIKRIRGKIIDELRKVNKKRKVPDQENSPNYYDNVSLDTPIYAEDDVYLYDVIPNEDPNPEEIHEKNEEKELLIAEIKQLKERDRLIITLYYFEDMNYKEIADVLNITVSRVSQIHTRIINRLKTKLELVNE